MEMYDKLMHKMSALLAERSAILKAFDSTRDLLTTAEQVYQWEKLYKSKYDLVGDKINHIAHLMVYFDKNNPRRIMKIAHRAKVKEMRGLHLHKMTTI